MQANLVPVSRGAMAAKISIERLRRMVQRGEVEGVMVEGRYFITISALEQLIAGRASAMPRPMAGVSGGSVR